MQQSLEVMRVMIKREKSVKSYIGDFEEKLKLACRSVCRRRSLISTSLQRLAFTEKRAGSPAQAEGLAEGPPHNRKGKTIIYPRSECLVFSRKGAVYVTRRVYQLQDRR